MRTALLLALACRPGADVPDDDRPATPTPTPAPGPAPTTPAPTTPAPATDTYRAGGYTTTVTIEGRDTLERTYHLSTDHPQRDGGPQQVTVVELPGQPVLRSGHDVLDALFALAVQEARENSVSEVTDFAFADGAPVACDCFRTGELWPWVWTRDTAYAVDLGLAWLDPARAAASLRFKLSEAKPGTGTLGPVVVQDTGSGGSWPVSTDRVVWALGAVALLNWLDGPERDAFRDEAYEALANTVEQDLAWAVDPDDGLLRGETSFLDWREQTYAPWTATDTARIAETKALSTNVGSLVALRALRDWATERGEVAAAARWADLADALEPAIRDGFAIPEGLASFTGGPLDPGPVRSRDWLGTSLAVLHAGGGAELVSGWPHGPLGPPVTWPQRPEAPVYHNRSQWPFVTAYGLRAARHVGNDLVVERAFEALARGAALNLSNMENFEWATLSPHETTVNSRRQLWSVAAFLAAVTDGLFGLRGGAQLTFDPLVPAGIRDRWLVADEVVLHRFPWRGRAIDVHLALPSAPGPLVGTGETWEGDAVTITLGPTASAGAVADAVVGEDLAPATPTITSVAGGRVAFTASHPVDVLRDGVVVATGVSGAEWVDLTPAGDAAPCYTLEAVDGFGNRSHRAAPACDWGPERVQALSTWALSGGGTWSEANGRPHLMDWGAPGDVLEVWTRPWHTGAHRIQVVYANGANAVNTGITAGHKRVVVREAATGAVVADRAVVLPHTGGWDVWRDSTSIPVGLDASTTYVIELSDAPNMSELEAHRIYTGGPGGGAAPYGFVDVAEVKLLALSGRGAAAGLGPRRLGRRRPLRVPVARERGVRGPVRAVDDLRRGRPRPRGPGRGHGVRRHHPEPAVHPDPRDHRACPARRRRRRRPVVGRVGPGRRRLVAAGAARARGRGVGRGRPAHAVGARAAAPAR